MKRDWWLAAAATLVVATAELSFYRVFVTDEWRPEALLALALAMLVAVAARMLRLPAVVSLLVSLAGLLVFATVVFVPDAGPFPGPEALRALVALFRDGMEQLRIQPAPSLPLDGLRLLVVGGVWVVTHVTHEALVRLRRPGLALLPPALLWLVPLAVPQVPGPTWPHTLPFLAAAAIVLMLEPNLDLTGWTREDDRPRLTRTGMIVTAGALTIAVSVPGILPGYGADPWLDVTATAEPRGYQPIVDIGDRLHLPDPRDLLMVTSPRPLYLRLAALETFDGRAWRLGPPNVATYRPDPDELFRTNGPLPFETTIGEGATVDASVEVLDLTNIYVPVPYQVQQIQGPSGASMFYSRDGGFVATGDLATDSQDGGLRDDVREGFAYDFESVIPDPAYADLAALGDFALPPGDPRVQLPTAYPDLADQARRVYDQAGASTTVDRVLALQDWFIGPDSQFTYSTDVPSLRGDSALRNFVFDSKVGYCEYYATAMAVMLRATGIPARVSVGFLPGRLVVAAEAPGEPAKFVVSTKDAHAWVEVLFPGYGWVKVDPTPRSDETTLPPTADNMDPYPSVTRDAPAPDEGNDFPTLPDQTDDRFPPATNNPGTPTTTDTGFGRWPWLLVVGVPLLAGLVLAVRRRPEEEDPVAAVLAVQRRVLRAAARLGVGRRPSETVSEVTARWVRQHRVTPDDAITFARLATTAAFGGTAPPEAGVEARALEERLVTQLRDSVGRRDRVLAPLGHLVRRVRDRAATVRQRAREKTRV